MKSPESIESKLGAAMFVLLLSVGYATAQSVSGKYACSEPNPLQQCNASNTCGSAAAPCTVDVKRTRDGASTTASIPNAKSNEAFCVKVGTTVTWKSSAKDIGFSLISVRPHHSSHLARLLAVPTALCPSWRKNLDVTSIPREPVCPGRSTACAVQETLRLSSAGRIDSHCWCQAVLRPVGFGLQ